jgi:hypothetical protein
MRRRGLVSALAAIALATTALTGHASVMLISAEMSGNSGGEGFSGGFPVPNQNTSYGPIPFPNDAQNFAGFTPDGLKVLVNREGSFSGNTHLGTYLRSWNQHSFKVVFDIDEPTPFTYHASRGVNTTFARLVSLTADGQPPVQALYGGDASGVLPSGRYTFSGGTGAPGFVPLTGPFSYVSNLTDIWLTVVPEPSALSLLAVPLAFACRRRAGLARRR